jgi:hypothetical protein
MLGLSTTFKKPDTYHSAVLARKFVKAGRVGLALVIRTTSLVGMIENIEVVAISVVASKDIGDTSQDQGLSDTSLSDGVWCFGLTLEDLPLKGPHIAIQYGQNYWIEDGIVTYLIVGVLSSSKTAVRAPAELWMEGNVLLGGQPETSGVIHRSSMAQAIAG